MKTLGEGTPLSGSIVAGGTAQDVAPRNPTRFAMTFQNTSDTEMRLREDGGTATAVTGYKIAAGDIVAIQTNQRISVFCATTGKTYAGTEI